MRDATENCVRHDDERSRSTTNRVFQKLCATNDTRDVRLKLGRAEVRESAVAENEGGSKSPPVFNGGRASGERMALARRTGVSAGE